MSASHERVLAALELREPDRVPTFDLMMEYAIVYTILGKKPGPLNSLFTNRYAARALDRILPLLDRSPFLSSALTGKLNDMEMEGFAHAAAGAAVKMGYDCAWVSYYPVFKFRDSKAMEDIFGRRYEIAIDKKGYLALPTYRGGLIAGLDDWKALDKKPLLRLPDKANRVFSAVQKELGDRLFIFGFTSNGPFENTWQPLGFERYAVAVRKERELLGRMIRFYTDLNCSILEAFSDAGLPGAVFSDDLAFRSGPMLNPKTLEELYGDSYRRITGTAHALGMKIIIHSCGNVSSLLEWFVDCGFDGVHPLEPTAGMDLADVKERVGDRICLIGNIDVTHVLVDASREEVFETVRRAIRDAGSTGGFILAPDHNHEDVSVERLRWMVEAGREYGRYPLK